MNSLENTGRPSSPAAAEKGPSPPPGLSPMAPFLLGGALLGALESAFFGGGKSRAAAALVAAIFGAILAAPFGLAGSAIAALSRRFRRARASTPEDGAEASLRRAAALRLYAHVIAAILVIPIVGVAMRFALFVLFDLQEEDLARNMAVALVTVASAGVVAAVFVGARGALRILTAIDRRRKLPVPLPGWALWALFVTVPLFAGLYPFMRQYGAMLGVAREGAALLFVTAIGVQTWLLLDGIPARAGKWLTIVVVALALTGAGVLGATGARMPKTFASAQKSQAAQLGAKLARFVTDVDRDGVSSAFGGNDCAPLDGRRAPTKVEVPGNGVDEDCDGSDSLPPGRVHRADLFSDALDPDIVRRMNVVWVVLETVRADHVSALSYGPPTTPYLSELAQESLLFPRAYSQSSATVFSMPSMMSGMEPSAARWKREHGHPQFADPAPLLAERLKKKGYRTGFVLDTYLQNNFLTLQRGFDQVLLAEPDPQKVNNRPRRNPFATAKAAEVLARLEAKDRVFLTVYYPDTHSPYTRHADVDSSSFDASPLGDYDTEIAWADQQIRALVEMLKSRPAIWDNTILVINADHGEEFGEHGGTRHAQTCHDESVHVPLLVRIPGVPAKRVESRVALVDVVPTILEAIGEREGADQLTGQSLLVPALRPDRVDPARPIFCDIASVSSKYGTFLRRAVRDGRYALFQDVTEGRYSLFDTQSDPEEREDLTGRAEHAEHAAALQALLRGKATGTLVDHTKMGAGPPPSSPAPSAPR